MRKVRLYFHFYSDFISKHLNMTCARKCKEKQGSASVKVAFSVILFISQRLKSVWWVWTIGTDLKKKLLHPVENLIIQATGAALIKTNKQKTKDRLWWMDYLSTQRFPCSVVVNLAELCVSTGSQKAASLPSCGYTEKQKPNALHSW